MPPPGGPLRHAPPIVLSFSPETSAVNVTAHEASIQFDEVVSERPQNAPDLSGLFLISPWDGEAHVGWHRDRISVRPRKGFRPNTVYTVTMLAGLTDLHNNVRRRGATLTFSTGPTIPATTLRGRVFDWLAGQTVPRAFVQAYMPADTTVVYVTEADSNGVFQIPHLVPGTYIVRGIIDGNHNRRLDRTELWDTTRVDLQDSARVELLAFIHDTIGPGISEITVRDSVTLRVMFDRGLDSTMQISEGRFIITARDSSDVPIRAARTAAEFDSAADSTRRAIADSIFKADSVRRAKAGLRVSDTATNRRREERVAARRDSLSRSRRPRPSRPIPAREVVIELDAPLKAGAYYRLRALDMTGLLGYTRTSERVFSTPKAATDSAKRSRGDGPVRRSVPDDKTARGRAEPAPPAAPPAAPASPPTPAAVDSTPAGGAAPDSSSKPTPGAKPQ